MKKIALATILSVASIAAAAQTSIYGSLRGFVDNNSVNGVSRTAMVSDLSHWGVSASEKMSGGLTARAVVETALAASNPVAGGDTKLGDRQSTIGLVNKTGSVDFGRAFNSYFWTLTTHDVFATHYGSVAGDVHNVGTVRSGDAVFVKFAAGPMAVAFDRTVTGASEVTTGSVGGSLGPVNATVAQFKSGADKSTMVAAQGKVLGSQVFVTVSESTVGGKDSRGTLVGVARAMGPTTLKASMGQKTGDVKAFSLGADYAMSKRTSVNVAFRSVDGASDVRQFGVGMTHKF